MPLPGSNLLVAIADQAAFVKINGRANVASSVHFKTLISNLRGSGFKNFLIDLSECGTMDSTFLGVLVGIVLNSSGSQPNPDAACVQLLNLNPRVADLLENLGVIHLFTVVQGENPAEASLQPSSQAGVAATREETSKTCLEAHRLLMAVNPDNVPKFKDVTQFLAEDLKNIQSQSR